MHDTIHAKPQEATANLHKQSRLFRLDKRAASSRKAGSCFTVRIIGVFSDIPGAMNAARSGVVICNPLQLRCRKFADSLREPTNPVVSQLAGIYALEIGARLASPHVAP